MNIKFYLVVSLVSFGFYQQGLACNTTTRPYEWPLFGNQEASVDLQADEEFFTFLLESVQLGREFALDAWATSKLKNGIANALGFRRFVEVLRKADKAGNEFARLELKERKLLPLSEHDAIYGALAQAKNPAFLLDVYSSSREQSYFDKNFGYLLGDSEGQTIEEKLLNAAIAKNWNRAREAKAEWLIKRSAENSQDNRIAEAFDLLRYVAGRGFPDVMYRLHQHLQTYPEFAQNEQEHLDYLNAATELGNLPAQYTSAMFAIRGNQFSQAKAHLKTLLQNAKTERDCFELKEAALFLKDFVFLLERNFFQDNPQYKFNMSIDYKDGGSLITASQRRAARLLRETFAEIDRLTKVLEDDSDDEEDDEQAEGVEQKVLPKKTQPVAKKKANRASNKKDTKEKPASEILDALPYAKNKSIVANDEDKKEDSASIPALTTRQKVEAPRKLSKKREKVVQRQAKRQEQKNSKPQQTATPSPSMALADNPFADVIRERLMPVQDLVATILDDHQYINKRETKRFLNALNNVQLENTVGSHNKVGITAAEGCDEQTMTIVNAHNGKRRDLTRKYKSMTGDLKRLLQGLGINSAKDLS